MDIQLIPLESGQMHQPPTEEFGFCLYFANRMFTQRYSKGRGWHDARIEPYGPFHLAPSTATFHYAQVIFEGLKAYRRPDGHINLFRPMENMRRFNNSARRMAMASVDEEEHLEAICRLIELEHEWVPRSQEATLYIRPAMIALDDALGVHASATYLHFVIISPVGPYFK